jgi:hypothetical protein
MMYECKNVRDTLGASERASELEAMRVMRRQTEDEARAE